VKRFQNYQVTANVTTDTPKKVRRFDKNYPHIVSTTDCMRQWKEIKEYTSAI